MPLTASQKALVKADVLADPALSALPNTPDGNFEIARLYNLTNVPDWFVYRTDVSRQEVQNAIVYANMTPAQTPDGTQAWANRALHAQGKQFNLQNLLLGNETINFALSNIRAGFQDCLTGLPTKNDGTNQAAGWANVQALMARTATRIEKILSTGTGTSGSPATMRFEGLISREDVELARNS